MDVVENAPIALISLADEPDRAADERDTLVTFLSYFRTVLVRKAAELTPAQLSVAIGASSLTIGGLVKHMAFVEDHWFQVVLLGNEYPEPWSAVDWGASPDWEFVTASDDSPSELLAQFRASVARSDAAIAAIADVAAVAARPSHGEPTTLRWILVHLVEEYARHCGHADLIRESIDGRTGD